MQSDFCYMAFLGVAGMVPEAVVKIISLLFILTIFTGQFSLAASALLPEVNPQEPQDVVPSEPYDDYDRIALALLQLDSRPQAGPELPQESFLRYLDQPASIQVVGNAFKVVFGEEEASQLADFLGSDTGQAGIGIFSTWLLSGDFLKNPVPVELTSGWETFRTTTAGIKLFAEVYTLYKEIAMQAVEIGGKLVAKAISSDIGKGAAAGILGTMLKSGAFFF